MLFILEGNSRISKLLKIGMVCRSYQVAASLPYVPVQERGDPYLHLLLNIFFFFWN